MERNWSSSISSDLDTTWLDDETIKQKEEEKVEEMLNAWKVTTKKMDDASMLSLVRILYDDEYKRYYCIHTFEKEKWEKFFNR